VDRKEGSLHSAY